MGTEKPETSSGFLQRLGYYALGIAIGLMLLGMFQARRQVAAQKQQQSASEAAEPAKD